MNDSVRAHIALFGGSFDPPHVGHLAIAHAAVYQSHVARVVFIPCAQSPLKTHNPQASGPHRVAMLRTMLAGSPWAEVSEWELAQPGPSYSWQTVAFFAQRFRGLPLAWIMGADQWEQLPRWQHPDRLAAALTFIVFPRDGVIPQPRVGFRAHFLPDAVAASSTEARAAIQAGKPTSLVTDEVRAYIAEHQLYSAK
jgi:nicotinate-nucleotide adenylyltransferase